MADYDFDIGVIGGGAGGLTVTSGAAQLGAKTLLVEKEKELGGDCLHFGCVPSKTLIKTAHVYHWMKNSEKFGLPAVDLPPVDFREISKRIKSVIGTIQHHDSKERFCNLGARVEFGRPTFIDEHSIRLNGHTHSAKTWVIATGSSPVAPPIKGLDKTHYITNKEIFYLDHLPKSMIVLGGGPIGTEMAQAFCRLGTKVSVVNRAPQILAKEDTDMADTVKEVLSAEGVDFYLNSSIEEVNGLGREKEVKIKTSEGSTISLTAETVLVALGRAANTNDLGLEKIGIEYAP
ncbi:MAG: FAD-dependent oxidoreductase, partial [Desulfobacterales bacterium]